MLTAAQRTGIIGYAADFGSTPATDDDIWYGFLSALFAAGKTVKDLGLQPAQKPEIMACLRRAPSVGPRTFRVGGERPVDTSPSSSPRRRPARG